MLAAVEHLSPQLLNDRGLREWSRLALLNPVARENELERHARKIEFGGEGCPLRLNTVQAVGLTEAAYMRGLFGSMPVGSGKTILSFLLPHFFPGIRNPMLFLPGGLMRKTEYEFESIKKYWRAPQYPVKVWSFDSLGRDKQAGLLCTCEKCVGRGYKPKDGAVENLRPDLVICDESDLLKNRDSSRTQRIMRYVANHPEVIFCCFTGTMLRVSLRDFMHLMILALKQNAPVPLTWKTQEMWCSALDLEPRTGFRRHPGALLRLTNLRPANDNNLTLFDCALDGFQRRMAETPGVIIRTEQSCDMPLYIRLLRPPDDPVLEQEFYNFRKTETTKDGWDVSAPLQKCQYGMTLATGFFNRWNPRPPREWLEARKKYHKLVRETIDTLSRRGIFIDSELQVRPHIKNHPDYLEWKRIEETFTPESEPMWLTMSVLNYIAVWIRLNSPALIWTQDIAVGEALEALTGVRYYGAGGLDRNKNDIEKADPRLSAIVSIGANKRGRNLQAWNRALVVSPPQPGPDWEQGCLGRIHRGGQQRPVYVDVLLSSADSLHALEKACGEARHVKGTTGFAQKLLLAHWDWQYFGVAEIANMAETDPRAPRWIRPKGYRPDVFESVKVA